MERYKSKEWGFYDAINSLKKKNTLTGAAIRAKVLEDKRNKRMRKVDTMFIFDPRVHMDLSREDLDKLESFEKLENMEWFTETQKLIPGASFGKSAILDREVHQK
jgi:hypothetical protein